MSTKTMQYEVIDDYLPKEEFEKIRDFMMGDDFPWFYTSNITFRHEQINNTMYFVHMFYKENKVNSNLYDLIYPIIRELKPKALLRVKANMYPNLGQIIENTPHVDYDFEHKGAIFYINTNNGPTVLEDGTKINAVENRILLFDSSKKHNSTHCTDQKVRVNININYF